MDRKSQQGSAAVGNKPKGLDLQKYGISYEGVSFKAGNKKGEERSMMIREGTFNQFIQEIMPISLKMAFLLTVFKKIILSHKPMVVQTFKELAMELGTSPETLRRYSKALQSDGRLCFKKLNKEDARVSNQYVFWMGPKFNRCVWESQLFIKAKKDHVDNSTNSVDNSEVCENQTVRGGLPEPSKQSVVDCVTVRSGLSPNIQISEVIDENSFLSLLPSLKSSLYKSSANTEIGETKVSYGEEEIKKKKKEMIPHHIQREWLEQTDGNVDIQTWREAVGR